MEDVQKLYPFAKLTINGYPENRYGKREIGISSMFHVTVKSLYP